MLDIDLVQKAYECIEMQHISQFTTRALLQIEALGLR